MTREGRGDLATPVCDKSDTLRTTPGAWFALWVLVIVTLVSFVDRQVVALFTQPIAESLGLRDSKIGIIQGLGSATFAMLATYPLGWLTDRYDRRFVLAACIVVWSAGTVACGFAEGFVSLFAAVVAIAAAEAGLPAIVYSVLPDLFRGRERVTANQIFYVAIILSSAAGIGIGGAVDFALAHMQGSLPGLFERFESWRIAFFLVAAPAPLLLLLVLTSRIGYRPAAPDTPSTAIVGREQPPQTLAPYIREYGRPAALVIAALCFYGLPFGAVLAWSPAGLMRVFGLAPSEIGAGLSIGLAVGCGVGVGLASLLMRALTPRLGKRAPLRISAFTLVLSIPLAGLMLVVETNWQAFAVIAAQMASGTLIGSLLPTMVQSLAPASLRGRVSALYGIVSTITTGAGISIVGPISDQISGNPRGLFVGLAVVLAISWLIGAVLFWFAERPFERIVRSLGEERL